MSLPQKMKALKSIEAKKAEVVEVPLPLLKDDYILVKTSAVALNPTDWKHIDFIPNPSSTVGCDYSGTVISTGSNLTRNFQPGDRVAGVVHGVSSNSTDNGAFGEYVVAKSGLQAHVPKAVSDEDAATWGVGVTTVGQGLNQSLGLPLPGEGEHEGEKIPVLVYGGSTATGFFAIQWAKLAGLTVITTCSPRNFDVVKSYGADVAFDYSDPEECAKNIREYANNKLKHAFDCISEGTSPKICALSLNPSVPTHYSSLLPVKDFPHPPSSSITVSATLAYTAIGEPFTFRGGSEIPGQASHYEFGTKVWGVFEKLVADGKIKAPPVREGKGGLEGVLAGLEELRKGRVSGEKLVYRLS